MTKLENLNKTTYRKSRKFSRYVPYIPADELIFHSGLVVVYIYGNLRGYQWCP